MRIESPVFYNEKAHAESVRRARRDAVAAAIESARADLSRESDLDLWLILVGTALVATGAIVGAFIL